MGRPTRLLPLLVVLLLIGPWPADAQNPDDSPARAAAAAGAVASSFAPDGVPQFLLATTDLVGPAGAQPGDLARGHLARFARAYRVSAGRPRGSGDRRRADRPHGDDHPPPPAYRRRRRAWQRRQGADPRRAARLHLRPTAAAGRRPRRRFRLGGRRRAGGRALSPLRHRDSGVRPDSGGRRSRVSRAAVRDGARKRGDALRAGGRHSDLLSCRRRAGRGLQGRVLRRFGPVGGCGCLPLRDCRRRRACARGP